MPPGGTRFAVARGLGSAAAALSRLTGSGGGTTIGGRVMLAVDPFALRRAAADPGQRHERQEQHRGRRRRVDGVEATAFPAAGPGGGRHDCRDGRDA